MAAYWSTGYLRKVVVYETDESATYGTRTVNYSGSAQSVSIPFIESSYLPWMPDFVDNAQVMVVQVTTTAGFCQYGWVTGN